MLGLLLAACSAPDADKPAGGTPPVLVGALSDRDAHAARFTLDGVGAADLRCVEDGGDALRATVGPVEVTVRGFLAGTTYRCAATLGERRSNTVELTTPPLPEAFPVAEVDVAGQAAEVGLHLVNLGRLLEPDGTASAWFGSEHIAVLDAEGRPRWRLDGVGGGDIDATWLADGTVLFGGFAGNRSVAPTRVSLDGDVLFSAQATPDTPWEPGGAWHHDAGIAADGASVWALTDEKIPDGDVEWKGFAVKRIDLATGETLWAWSSVDDGVASGALVAGDRYDVDPWHANAVWDTVEDGRDKLYVSLRGESQVIRIDVETRAVDLKIGLYGDLDLLDATGAPAEADQWFFGQHDAKRIGDRLVVYDNGLGRDLHGSAPWSRALVLLLDEDAGTARIETGWRGDTDWASPAWGGLDRRDDGRLGLAVGHFWWVDEDSPQRSNLALLDPDGEGDATLGWRLVFPDRDVALYRSEHLADPCASFPIEAYCF